MKTSERTRQLLALCGLWLSLVSRAQAASSAESRPNPSPAQPIQAAPPSPEQIEQARQHYARALEHYDAGAHADALRAFQSAYAIMRDHRLLFNIGQLELLLRRYARARQSLSRYLEEGGDSLGKERRAQVSEQLEILAQRTGRLIVKTKGRGARVEIDAQSFEPASLERGVFVDAGEVTLVASTGSRTLRRTVFVAPGEVVAVSLEEPADVASERVTPPGENASQRAPRSHDPPPASSRAQLEQVVWISSGVLGLGAAGSAVATLLTSRRHEELRGEATSSAGAASARARLDRQRTLVHGLAVTSDVLALAAIATAGAGLYLTLVDDDSADLAVTLAPALNSLHVMGRF